MAIPAILQQLNRANPALGQIRQAAQALKNLGNPQIALQQLMQTNPQMRQVEQLIREAGGDPQRAFYELARKKGVDPNDILSALQ